MHGVRNIDMSSVPGRVPVALDGNDKPETRGVSKWCNKIIVELSYFYGGLERSKMPVHYSRERLDSESILSQGSPSPAMVSNGGKMDWYFQPVSPR